MQETRIKLLQSMPVFGGVRADILDFLLKQCPVVSIPAQKFFFHENDDADSIFVLEAGEAALLKSWGGREYLLRTMKVGDCFGEMAIMAFAPRNASARAVEDCSAIRLSVATLHQLYAHDLEQFTLIQMNMGREVARRLRESDDRLLRAAMGSPDADASAVDAAIGAAWIRATASSRDDNETRKPN